MLRMTSTTGTSTSTSTTTIARTTTRWTSLTSRLSSAASTPELASLSINSSSLVLASGVATSPSASQGQRAKTAGSRGLMRPGHEAARGWGGLYLRSRTGTLQRALWVSTETRSGAGTRRRSSRTCSPPSTLHSVANGRWTRRRGPCGTRGPWRGPRASSTTPASAARARLATSSAAPRCWRRWRAWYAPACCSARTGIQARAAGARGAAAPRSALTSGRGWRS
mmetsp:Transcript_32685/g.76999  ORF Transcript_32685/g.76999 Transcript_32685/m.76999 type:complete len:224 (-) Transcript_32685:696-1367(-)